MAPDPECFPNSFLPLSGIPLPPSLSAASPPFQLPLCAWWRQHHSLLLTFSLTVHESRNLEGGQCTFWTMIMSVIGSQVHWSRTIPESMFPRAN